MYRVILAISIIIISAIPLSYAQLELFTNSKVYSAGQPLFVFGNAMPGEDIIIRVFGPDDTITKFDQIAADTTGHFQHTLLVWPDASITFPYGTYSVEALSAGQGGLSQTINVQFSATSELVETPVQRSLQMSMFAPETAAVNSTMRIFVQVTSDGLLVGNDPGSLLDTTHVHKPDGTVLDISNGFQAMHQGLFYADYTPVQEGTYVFHAVSFHQGTISHGSVATTILKQDIGGISEQILNLSAMLTRTSEELQRLQLQVSEFNSTMRQASSNIDESVGSVSASVSNIEDASLQLNSLFFPVVALIAVIVALQIATLARSR